MATDSLTDPKVKRKLISCFHVWSLAYAVSSSMDGRADDKRSH